MILFLTFLMIVEENFGLRECSKTADLQVCLLSEVLYTLLKCQPSQRQSLS